MPTTGNLQATLQQSALRAGARCARRSHARLLAGVVLWFALPAVVVAQDSRVRSTRTESTRQSVQKTAAELRELNRHLLTGLGSGTNKPPGWYSRNLSQPVVESGALVTPFLQPLVPLQLSQVVVVQTPPPVVVEAPPVRVVVVERERPPEPRHRDAAPRWTPEPPASPFPAPVPASPPAPRFVDPQPVGLRILPADAVVHLDDERLGAGDQVPSSLHLEPGVHVLEVSHAALPPQRLVFGVADEAMTIVVDLAADRPSRRTRVR